MKKYSVEIAKAIQSFLKSDDWHFSFDDKEGRFKFGLATRSKIKHLNYHILVYDDGYTVYTISPVGADHDDKEMMQNMAEFVCRANYGLRNGNFEMDFNDGEVRYKTFVDCDGGAVPTNEIVKGSIYVSISMFRRYGDGILDVIYQNVPAKKVVAKCEGREEEEDDIQVLLEELADGEDEETRSMIERLEAKLGISKAEDRAGAAVFPQDEAVNVHTDVFGTKGGAK